MGGGYGSDWNMIGMKMRKNKGRLTKQWKEYIHVYTLVLILDSYSTFDSRSGSDRRAWKERNVCGGVAPFTQIRTYLLEKLVGFFKDFLFLVKGMICSVVT